MMCSCISYDSCDHDAHITCTTTTAGTDYKLSTSIIDVSISQTLWGKCVIRTQYST